MNRQHDHSGHPGPSLWVRPRSQATLLEGDEGDEGDASVVARVTRQLLDAVRSLAA